MATALLAEAALRPAVPLEAVAQLRAFIVANLRHQDHAGTEGVVRAALHAAAIEARDTVHDRPVDEEPLPADWEEFSRRVIAGTPPAAGHLMIGLLDEVGSSDEVALVLEGLPESILRLLPEMRRQATDDLRILRGAGS
ncbi:hypothetical protein [Streptomyces sp. NPDC058964]|uniref:hypothetical protein n=1 Tax=Streptomyces sp. NPDC058964 TaxID=3346681 RepID=UPI0036A1CFCC